MRSLLAVLVTALLLGCPSQKPSAEQAEEDRTLMKLKQAQGDPGRGPPSREAPNEKLADLAAKGSTDEAGPRPLPAKNETVHLGSVALKLTSVSTSPIVKGGKLSLSTDQLFLIVRLMAQNVGEREQELDLTTSSVKVKDTELSLARDAQRVAGTRELSLKLGPGESQRAELILVFEVAPELLGAGMVLSLKSPGVDPVTLPLE